MGFGAMGCRTTDIAPPILYVFHHIAPPSILLSPQGAYVFGAVLVIIWTEIILNFVSPISSECRYQTSRIIPLTAGFSELYERPHSGGTCVTEASLENSGNLSGQFCISAHYINSAIKLMTQRRHK